MTNPQHPISPQFVRLVFGSIATAIRAEDTSSALAFADAMLGRADYAPAEHVDATELKTMAYLHREFDHCVSVDRTAYANHRELVLKSETAERIAYLEAERDTWRTYAIEAGRQLAERRNKVAYLVDPIRAALEESQHELQFAESAKQRLQDLAEALERRIETFAALPWYTRAWRAINGDI